MVLMVELPPNFNDLPIEMQRLVEEDLCRKMLMWNHGYGGDDSKLDSFARDSRNHTKEQWRD
jgi:hypothetical protein